MKEREIKEAFDRIEITEEMQNRILEKCWTMEQKRSGGAMKKRMLLTAAAATLILGSTAFAATYLKWSHGMEKQMGVSVEQMAALEGRLASFPDVSDTQNGITVSTAQCLFDGNDIRMAFYVEGYSLEEGEEPALENLDIFIDGEQVNNYEWFFYNGIDWNENREPMMADGSPVQMDAEGRMIPDYYNAEGKMELDVRLSPVDEKGNDLSALSGKTIAVQMGNFGDTTGVWRLEWTLGEEEGAVKAQPEAALGDSGATVTSVALFQTSAVICYDFPKQELQGEAVDENGNIVTFTEYAEPPAFLGFQMQDGTVCAEGLLSGGGSSGYIHAEGDVFVTRVSFAKVIDPKEVQSLLFWKKDGNFDRTESIAENCYVVDLK